MEVVLVLKSLLRSANTCVTQSYYPEFIFLSIMSVNDKVKVIWETNCQWKDPPHWPKWKEVWFSSKFTKGQRFLIPLIIIGWMILSLYFAGSGKSTACHHLNGRKNDSCIGANRGAPGSTGSNSNQHRLHSFGKRKHQLQLFMRLE